ncbi:hypothetical protein EBR96_03910 [bacterium]|nr:hypothetical protein [bacterium]
MRHATREASGAVTQTISNGHPYPLPEVVAVPLVGGVSGYWRWLGALKSGPWHVVHGTIGYSKSRLTAKYTQCTPPECAIIRHSDGSTPGWLDNAVMVLNASSLPATRS